MKVLHVLTISGLLLVSSLVVAEHGSSPADGFRKTAAEYEQYASKAVKKATSTQGEDVGRYLELSSVYREMAQIKHGAAKLADQGRWNDITWERYHQLESRRDQLLGQLDWSQTRKQAHKNKQAGGGFNAAAKDYESKARQAHDNAQRSSGPAKHMYSELAGIYQAMANIKHQAADAVNKGKDFDWSKYHELEFRRDKVKSQLNHATTR